LNVTEAAIRHLHDEAPVARIPNKVGRPRAFQDDDVYRVMMSVISEVGYARLTFSLIAAEIRCTTSALIRRFGDKKSLVQGFITWVTERQEVLFAQYADRDLSPLDVLRARAYLPVQADLQDERTAIQDTELFLAFFIEARSEPAYRPQLGNLTREFEIQAVETIKAAVEVGQLKECDAEELAHLIVCALVGAQSLWLDHQNGSLLVAMDRAWASVLEPYLA
jgi:AcrR family transcriptional regulator